MIHVHAAQEPRSPKTMRAMLDFALQHDTRSVLCR
jgi:hypothetical protein